MIALVAFGLSGLATWLLRVCFITVLPADRMPEAFRRLLRHLGPAVMSTLLVLTLAGEGGARSLLVPSGRHLALLAAGVVAWRCRNVALPLAVAVGVAYLAT